MKKISPVAINALRRALTHVYWYKSDLRSFLTQCLGDPSVLSRLNWDAFKREIVDTLIEHLVRHEQVYQRDLLRLMSEVARFDHFGHLDRLDDGRRKTRDAKEAVAALRHQMTKHLELFEEQRASEDRRKRALEDRMRSTAVRQRLAKLHNDYVALLQLPPQKRGYELEALRYGLFDLFDLDPRAAFRVTGEQIDGSFSFEGTDYLFEARWEDQLTPRAEIDAFDAKIGRKLENTLGLFLSINGFSGDGVTVYSGGRSLMILMDGSDLMAVLEARIDLARMLLRKRRHAAQTGNIYLTATEYLR
jgi:hypothetical protein